MLFLLNGGITNFEKGMECRFSDVNAPDGIFFVTDGEMSIKGCDIANNLSFKDMVVGKGSKLLFKDMSISENSSIGGDIIDTASGSDLTMKNVKITSNVPGRSILELNQSSAKFIKVEFESNSYRSDRAQVSYKNLSVFFGFYVFYKLSYWPRFCFRALWTESLNRYLLDYIQNNVLIHGHHTMPSAMFS